MTNPVVYLPLEVKQTLDLYIGSTTLEISGLGEVETFANGAGMIVTKLYLFEQECSVAETLLDQDVLSEFLYKAIEDGVDTSKLKLWWHSHAFMSCFWSATDEDTIELLTSDWMLSIVGNRKGEYLARLDLAQPFRLSLDKLKMDIYQPVPDSLARRIKEEVGQKVKRKVIPVTQSKAAGFTGWSSKAWDRWRDQWEHKQGLEDDDVIDLSQPCYPLEESLHEDALDGETEIVIVSADGTEKRTKFNPVK